MQEFSSFGTKISNLSESRVVGMGRKHFLDWSLGISEKCRSYLDPSFLDTGEAAPSIGRLCRIYTAAVSESVQVCISGHFSLLARSKAALLRLLLTGWITHAPGASGPSLSAVSCCSHLLLARTSTSLRTICKQTQILLPLLLVIGNYP